jgi:hypothetical protein
MTSRCSTVANTGLIADGFNKPTCYHWLTQTSPNSDRERIWLVIAITTTSGLVVL